MLNEEALILLAVVLAFGLLALGVWEQLAPARPRRAERRAPARPAPTRAEWSVGVPSRRSAGPETSVVAAPLTVPSRRAPSDEGREEPSGSAEAAGASPSVGPETVREGDEIEDRRLWRRYTNLGLQHLDAGRLEAALEPLCHALRLKVAPERRLETRVALVRAFEEIVEQRSERVRRLLAAGEPRLADVEIEMTWSLLKAGIDRGVPQDDLGELLARVERLVGDLEHHRA
jgi:hypothetical protein